VKAGLDDGRFLVRSRDNKVGEYVLCVVYKGKPTHHLIAKNPDGIYCINKKSYGEYTKVNRVSGPAFLVAFPCGIHPGYCLLGMNISSPSQHECNVFAAHRRARQAGDPGMAGAA